MANWNKRSAYKKENPAPESLTPWEKMRKDAEADQSGSQTTSKFTRNQGKKREKKVVSMEQKLPKLKELRRKKMLRRLISLIFLFSFAIILIIYFISPYSHIAEISVSGTSEVADQAIIDATQLKKGDPLWSSFFDQKKTTKKILSQLEQVKSAKLEFSGINSFRIAVKEYKTVAYLSENNGYHNILENGKIVKESRKVSIGNPPIFVNFKEGPALDEMVSQYDQLGTNIKNSISEIEFKQSDSDDYLININMNDGNQVIASIPKFADNMAYYPDIVRKLEGKKGVINLEVGAYYSEFPTKSESK